jgi:hypothetical protein
MRFCTHCQGKFGLIRYGHFRRMFCSKRCKNDFYEARRVQFERSRKRWLGFLAS